MLVGLYKILNYCHCIRVSSMMYELSIAVQISHHEYFSRMNIHSYYIVTITNEIPCNSSGVRSLE